MKRARGVAYSSRLSKGADIVGGGQPVVFAWSLGELGLEPRKRARGRPTTRRDQADSHAAGLSACPFRQCQGDACPYGRCLLDLGKHHQWEVLGISLLTLEGRGVTAVPAQMVALGQSRRTIFRIREWLRQTGRYRPAYPGGVPPHH